MPMTPSQYAQTAPHHTVYGCLYPRDAPGEGPLQTARREAVKETGLNLGPATPRLLLTHFLHAGPRQPLNKRGVVFDGSRLTADQLGRIRLDPTEDGMWAVHGLASWQELRASRAFVRLDAIERARRGEAPTSLSTAHLRVGVHQMRLDPGAE